MTRSYTGLVALDDFDSRFDYLRSLAEVGSPTFGNSRYLNQKFYSSREWRSVRDQIIIRDSGCDLGLDGYELRWKLTVHHINPITEEDILNRSDLLFDPENLITVSYTTHKAIHFGKEFLLMPKITLERTPNDTCPWKVGTNG